MNALDVVRFGHLTFLGALDNCTVDEEANPGACGIWSVKDIVAHIASYELVLIDILNEAAGQESGPNLNRFREPGSDFNDAEVANRCDRSFDGVLDELNGAHATVLTHVSGLTPEHLRRPGAIPWYGPDYSLDDLIVYMYYGHKREHAAQIAAFRDSVLSSR